MALTSRRTTRIVPCELPALSTFSLFDPPSFPSHMVSLYFLNLTEHVQALGLDLHFLILQARMIFSELYTWLLLIADFCSNSTSSEKPVCGSVLDVVSPFACLISLPST